MNLTITPLNDSMLQKGVSPIGVIKSDLVFVNFTTGDIYIKKLGGDNYMSLFNSSIKRKHTFLSNAWVDEETIGVFDPQSGSIYSYTVDGVIKRQAPLSYLDATSAISKGENIYLDFNRRPPFEKKGEKNNVLEMDWKGQEKSWRYPYKYKLPTNYTNKTSNFESIEGGIYYHQTLSENIFFLGENQKTGITKVDFGDKWAWKSEELLNSDEFKNIRADVNKISSFTPVFGTERLLIVFKYRNKKYTLLKNENDISLLVNSEFIQDLRPYFWHKGKLLIKVKISHPSDLLSFSNITNSQKESGYSLISKDLSFYAWISFEQ